MKRIFLISILVVIINNNFLFAQTKDDFIEKKIQIGILYPLGSNWTNNKVVNKFSLNLLLGYSHGLDGLEIGGLANMEKDFVRGFQFAGIGNVIGGNVKGVQLGGLLNKAENVTGMQIGLVNFRDSIKGVPIGFLSFVKDGYRIWEVWLSESIYFNTAYKIGIQRLYNVFALSVVPFGQNPIWALGYGLGTEFELNTKHLLDMDVLIYHISDDEVWTNELNRLYQLRIMYGKKNIEYDLYFGPTINVFVTQFVNKDNKLGSDIAPYYLYDETNDSRVIIWLGLNLGIKVHPVKNLGEYGW